MKTYLIQENGENVDMITLTDGMAGSWPITAISDYVEAQGFARYDEYTEDSFDYILANDDNYAECIFCNGYLTASVIGVHRVGA